MKKLLSKNRIIGLAALIVFTLTVTFGTSSKWTGALLFFLLGIVVSAASFYLLNRTMPSDRDESWLFLAASITVMTLVRMLAGWDFYLPFLFCGLIGMAVDASTASLRALTPTQKKNGGLLGFLFAIKAFGAAVAVMLLFVCICAFVGVYV